MTDKLIHRFTGLAATLLLLVQGCASSDEGQSNPVIPELTFTIKVSISGCEAATVAVTPSDDLQPYCLSLLNEAEYHACAGEASIHLSALIRREKEADPALTDEQIVASLQRTGPAVETYRELVPGSSYHAMVFGLADDASCTTQARIEAFATPGQPAANDGFEVRVTDVGATVATVSVTPDNDAMPYYFDIVTEADYAACGGDLSIILSELLSFLREQNPGRSTEEITAAIQSRGPDSDTIGPLPPSTGFYAFAIGLDDDGTCTTEAQVTPFRTLKTSDPAKCSFTLWVDDIGNRSATVGVIPSDGTTGYFTSVIPESEYAGDVQLSERIRRAIEQIATERNLSVTEVVEAICYHGPSSEYQDGLDSSTDYYAFAYALNPDATAAGAITKQRFTTLGENISAATCTLECDRYFDGDELHALDPVKYANLKGKVYASITAHPSTDALHWYAALGRGDMTDPTFYPDETTINALLQAGTPDKTQMLYVAEWGEATLLAVAADEYYQFGTVFRLLINFDKTGASPAETLDPLCIQSQTLLEADAAQREDQPEVRLHDVLTRRTVNAQTSRRQAWGWRHRYSGPM